MRCSFCGNEIMRGSGKIFAKKEGTVFFFCSKKCEKNLLKLKRNPHTVKWTNAFQKQKSFHAEKGKRFEEKKGITETLAKEKIVSSGRAEKKKLKKARKAKAREKRKRREERKKTK